MIGIGSTPMVDGAGFSIHLRILDLIISAKSLLPHKPNVLRLQGSEGGYLWKPLLSLRDPWWLSGKESACSAGDVGLIPGLERSLGGGNGNPLQYACLGNPMDRGAWRAPVLGVAVGHDLATHRVLLFSLRHPSPGSPLG